MIIKRILKTGTPANIITIVAISAIIVITAFILERQVITPYRNEKKSAIYSEHVGHCTNLIVAEFEIEQGEVERAHQLCRKIYASEHSK